MYPSHAILFPLYPPSPHKSCTHRWHVLMRANETTEKNDRPTLTKPPFYVNIFLPCKTVGSFCCLLTNVYSSPPIPLTTDGRREGGVFLKKSVAVPLPSSFSFRPGNFVSSVFFLFRFLKGACINRRKKISRTLAGFPLCSRLSFPPSSLFYRRPFLLSFFPYVLPVVSIFPVQ